MPNNKRIFERQKAPVVPVTQTGASPDNVKSKAKPAVRARTWATIVYPESAPLDWQERLGEQCIPCFVSPLHDKDINPTGEPKKPHYHVLFCYDGKKTFEQVSVVVSIIGGVGCKRVQSTRGYARYLCHLDNPEKAQYQPNDVKQFAGADYLSIIGLPVDKYKALCEMQEYCIANNVFCYADLVDYARQNEMGWFRVLADTGSIMMREYLKSMLWKQGRNN